ncbi:MAG: hypothetical protein Tsb0013_13760 [Phycisphaerales bacterium]
MGVTAKLLKLYRVDQKLNGLKRRLRAAERYLAQQETELQTLTKKHASLDTQLRQIQASIHNDETEIKRLDDKIATNRERMNNAATSKEHSALLTEINTMKADRAIIEERVLEMVAKSDELNDEVSRVDAEVQERTKVREIAQTDRDEREAEIGDKLKELETERAEALKDVPADALSQYQGLLETALEDDEVMAPVNEEDRRNKEYTCGACYTLLPVEQVNVLLTRGAIQVCPSCSVILYIEQDLRESIETAMEKKRAKAAKA